MEKDTRTRKQREQGEKEEKQNTIKAFSSFFPSYLKRKPKKNEIGLFKLLQLSIVWSVHFVNCEMVKTKSTIGAKATKMLDYINHMIRVELKDG